jgi:hypothetical protein
MIDRIIIWIYDHRRRLFLFLCSPLLFITWQWLSDNYLSSLKIGEEQPVYDIPLKHKDDTLRVAVIGDSWAEYHTTLECDTIFCRVAKGLTSIPVKCFSTGHSGKMSKEIYNEMFANRTVEHEWERQYCSQPLIEQHPDYCVVMVGINDMRMCRSVDFYVGNYLLILRFLLHHDIRPVVMEMPDVDFRLAFDNRKFYEQWVFRLLSLWTKVDYNSAQVYRDAMRKILQQEGLKDKVLFIPESKWNPGGVDANPDIYLDDRFHLNMEGYHVLDTCMAKEIINDYKKRKRIIN